MNTEQSSNTKAEFVEETHNRRLVVTNDGQRIWNWEIREKFTKYMLCRGTIDPGYYAEDVLKMVSAINGSLGNYLEVKPPAALADWYQVASYSKAFGTHEITLSYLENVWGWSVKDTVTNERLCSDVLPPGQTFEAALVAAQKALDDAVHIGTDRQLPVAQPEPTCIEVPLEFAPREIM